MDNKILINQSLHIKGEGLNRSFIQSDFSAMPNLRREEVASLADKLAVDLSQH